MTFKIIVLLALYAITGFSQLNTHRERKLYVGKNSTEAIMTFSHFVEESDYDHSTTLAEAKETINRQLMHLFGPMGVAKYKSVPLGDEKITQVKINYKNKNTAVISYNYKGTIVVENGPTDTYEVILPINPYNIYDDSLVRKTNGQTIFPCTDEHYNSQSDFWYFWNPAKTGCKLVEGKDYQKIKVNIKRIANTTLTYPEYERLVDKEGNIRISILMGMDDPTNDRDPNISKDINATNFRKIHRSLVTLGYKAKVLSTEKVKELSGPSYTLPYVEEFSKKTKKANIIITLFFGQSGLDQDSRAFHYFLKDALENASVMTYDGHSGLGGHLNLDYIESEERFKLKPNKNRYQIYYFNGCSTYTYYNTYYFERKMSAKDPKGTKNLDILTNGLETYFNYIGVTDLALVKAIEAWSSDQGLISYQQIAKEIDSDNLFGINGDEDNAPYKTIR